MDVKLLHMLLLLLAAAGRCDALHACNGTKMKRLEQVLEKQFPERPVTDGSPRTCPVLLRSEGAVHERSLAPWRYVTKTLKDHVPETYSEAECLCRGCVLWDGATGTVKETEQYNSVPVLRALTFLKKVPSSSGSYYRLKPVTVTVTVGCTCAAPSQ